MASSRDFVHGERPGDGHLRRCHYPRRPSSLANIPWRLARQAAEDLKPTSPGSRSISLALMPLATRRDPRDRL